MIIPGWSCTRRLSVHRTHRESYRVSCRAASWPAAPGCKITMSMRGARQAAHFVVQSSARKTRPSFGTGGRHETMPPLRKAVWPCSQNSRRIVVDEGVLLKTMCGCLRQGASTAREAETVSRVPLPSRLAARTRWSHGDYQRGASATSPRVLSRASPGLTHAGPAARPTSASASATRALGRPAGPSALGRWSGGEASAAVASGDPCGWLGAV
jgi:hypothetical protein